MIYLIVGHRGVGKTHWLNLIQGLFHEKRLSAQFFDLDEQIEKQTQSTIQDLFLKGEAYFRKKEKEVFESLIKNQKGTCFISCGAGFRFKKEKNFRVIHLARVTDLSGRLFFDRPALSSAPDLYRDSIDRYHERQKWYSDISDETLYRMEHFKNIQESDKVFLGLKKESTCLFSMTLSPDNTSSNKTILKEFLKKRLGWGIRFFEIKDEDLSQETLEVIYEIIPKDKLLFSSHKLKKIPDKFLHWSWDINLGKIPQGVSILSLHERGSQDISQILEDFSKYKTYHLKLAIEIFNLKELWQAWKWQQKDPQNRSFLPRSQTGRWKWFRQAFGSQMWLNFICEKQGEVRDQPLFAEAFHYKKPSVKLAGVLGYPISFSASPYEHDEFFYQKKQIAFIALPFKQSELNKTNFSLFADMGFVFFAVTSPLKELAYNLADVKDPDLSEIKSANTLIYHNQKWQAYNTDRFGFEVLKKEIKHAPIVVWGGGGTRAFLKESLKEACFYSARKGQILFSDSPPQNPATLIWAVGRERMNQGLLWPPDEWQPLCVIDLNYMDNSPGREYAIKKGISYKDGWSFFKEQARQQREIFLRLNKK